MKPSNSAQGAQLSSLSSDDDDWEKDMIWDLLRESTPRRASAGFANQVMQSVRDSGQMGESTHWHKAAFRSALGVAAALVLAFAWWSSSTVERNDVVTADAVMADEFEPLEEAVTQQVLLAAADQLHDFSDTELVTLIGF